MLIGTEAVVSAGGDESSVAFRELQLFSVDVEYAAPLEDDVQLVACVHALMVWFRRDQRVDTDLESPRLVNDLATTISGAKARFCPGDFESVSRSQRVARHSVG